jgi:hypothetical protein
MLNVELIQGDILSDMVPKPNSTYISPGGQPSIKLGIGNSLYSPGGAFRFTLQSDGNAVVQCVVDSTLPSNWRLGQALNASTDLQWLPITSTQTHDKGVVEVDMQADGNLVAYNGSGPAFQSNTANNPGAFLRMQDDGNLVIYGSAGGVLWSTGTNARGK